MKIDLKYKVAASVLALSFILSGCGDESKNDLKEYELNVTQDENKTITINFALLKDNVFASLQLSPSIKPPVTGDMNLSKDGANNTQKYSDFFDILETNTGQTLPYSKQQDFISSNELYKESPIIDVDVLKVDKKIVCSYLGALQFSCKDSNTSEEQNITFTQGTKYHILYRSNDVKTIVTPYIIKDANLTAN